MKTDKTQMFLTTVVVCPGEGFSAGDTATASAYRPWGLAQTLTDKVNVTLVEN